MWQKKPWWNLINFLSVFLRVTFVPKIDLFAFLDEERKIVAQFPLIPTENPLRFFNKTSYTTVSTTIFIHTVQAQHIGLWYEKTNNVSNSIKVMAV